MEDYYLYKQAETVGARGEDVPPRPPVDGVLLRVGPHYFHVLPCGPRAIRPQTREREAREALATYFQHSGLEGLARTPAVARDLAWRAELVRDLVLRPIFEGQHNIVFWLDEVLGPDYCHCEECQDAIASAVYDAAEEIAVATGAKISADVRDGLQRPPCSVPAEACKVLGCQDYSLQSAIIRRSWKHFDGRSPAHAARLDGGEDEE